MPVLACHGVPTTIKAVDAKKSSMSDEFGTWFLTDLSFSVASSFFAVDTHPAHGRMTSKKLTIIWKKSPLMMSALSWSGTGSAEAF